MISTFTWYRTVSRYTVYTYERNWHKVNNTRRKPRNFMTPLRFHEEVNANVAYVALVYGLLVYFALRLCGHFIVSSTSTGTGQHDGRCLSVCLSVCRMPQLINSRSERLRKPKIDVMKEHHTDNQWTYLEVKRSKVKVTRPINAFTDNAAYARWREFPWRKGEQFRWNLSIFH